MEQLHIGNEPALLKPVVLCLTVCVKSAWEGPYVLAKVCRNVNIDRNLFEVLVYHPSYICTFSN